MERELTAVVMGNGAIELEWEEVPDALPDRDRQHYEQEVYRRFRQNVAEGLLFLGFSDTVPDISVSLGFWRNFAKIFAKKVSRTPDIEKVREKIRAEIEKQELNELIQQAPFMAGAEYLNTALLDSLWSGMNARFQMEIEEYEGTVADLLRTYSPNIHLVGRVYFHLVENKNPQLPFAFLATYSTALNEKGQSRHLPLNCALQEYAGDERKLLDLLITVDEAARQSELIAGLLDSGEIFHPLAWSAGEAFTFLKEVPIYERAGILCRIPDWWKNRSSALRVNISVGGAPPSRLGMEALLSFDAGLMLGDQEISAEEAREILEHSEGLARIKGKWIEVNSDKLRQALEVFEKAQRAIAGDELSIKDAMQLHLGVKKLTGAEDELLEISYGTWLESVMTRLQNPRMEKETGCGDNFHAGLRPYQKEGLNWLFLLHSLQFGACLADDMGLGKTVQVLALLNRLRDGKSASSLLVIPASLLANWKSEIERFTPSLKYYIVHPGFNPEVKSGGALPDSYDLMITTYALVSKYEWLQKHKWDYVILDEAQAIKNPGTKQTRAVKKLDCRNRLALTGTPVENKLGDLWSLYDFLNPGLLGTAGEFTHFANSLKDDPRGYARLKRVVSPYLLRRLKTDKSIITDLPDKIEMKTYAEPSKKQIVLYRQLVKDIENGLKQMEGIQRKGLILSSLLKFKQICNHPGQYLGNGDFAEKDSGKFERLREICETIYEKREKVLVFTQFQEIIAALHEFMAGIFSKGGLALHGGTPVKKRKELIDRFQSKEYVPFFILSVRAGGVGINLTEANHVVHFDRWWNPAVENQATDRAFRIGQQKKVVVHKFIMRGTIEEKIDVVIEEKLSLAQQIVHSTGENWILKMGNEEILDLFRLSL